MKFLRKLIKMNRKHTLLKALPLMLAMSFLPLTMSAQKSGMSRAAEKYSQVLYLIDRLYLEDVDFEKLVGEALEATMGELDPHSSYISAEDAKAMNEPLQGQFEGIGIEFAIIEDTLTVQATVAGGPSEKVGLLAGDKIIRVDTSSIAGVGLAIEDVHGYLRGKKGTKVELDVLRRGVTDTLDFTIVRDKIPLNSLDAAYEVEDGILYMKLSRFALASAEEIHDAMKSFDGEIKGVILDLRGNSGGFLPTAIDIADEFLEKDDLIVYTEGRRIPRMEEYARGNGLYRHGPLVVMIDENSASASEIVDGSEIRLTIARYHTPSGRVIQSPYENGKADEYYGDFYERYMRGESFSRDSIHFPDSLRFKTLRLGRTVYGGGGIMPDVFVPQDTTAYSAYYASLLRQGLVMEYMNGLCDRHRAEWTARYRNFDRFNEHFEITDWMIDSLVALAGERGIAPDPEGLARSREDLSVYMKALAASSIFSRDCFYRIMNARSPEFQAALEALREASLSSNALL